MNKIMIVLICTIIAMVAQARLGETYDQCVERYGQPVSEKNSTAIFSKPPFKITVGFSDNRAAYVFYERPGSFMNDSIPKTERLSLLDANRGNFKWSEYTCPEQYRDQHILNDLWQRTDGSMACYELKSSTLMVVNKSLAPNLFNDGKKATNGL